MSSISLADTGRTFAGIFKVIPNAFSLSLGKFNGFNAFKIHNLFQNLSSSLQLPFFALANR